MVTTIDKAGRVVIPTAIQERAGFRPGSELEITVDDFGVRLERRPSGPRLTRVGRRLVARPTVKPDNRPDLDLATLVEGERRRYFLTALRHGIQARRRPNS